MTGRRLLFSGAGVAAVALCTLGSSRAGIVLRAELQRSFRLVQCAEKTWQRPRAVELVPQGTVLRFPIGAVLRGNVWTIGTLFPAWPTSRLNEHVDPLGLLLVSSSSDSVVAQQGTRHYLHARGDVDARGQLHLVWGEPRVRDSATITLRRYLTEPAASLWYASFDDRAGWSEPVQIYEHPVDAGSGARDAITRWRDNGRVVVDAQGRVHVAFINAGRKGGIVHLVRDADSWLIHRVPVHSAGYTDMALGPGNRIHLLYDQPEAGGPSIISSLDNGVTWSVPRTIGSELGTRVSEPRLLADSHGLLHALWRWSSPRHSHSEIRYAWSVTGGATWSTPTTAPPAPHGILDLGISAVVDDCGAVYVAYPEKAGLRVARFGLGAPSRHDILTEREPREMAFSGGISREELSIFWSAYVPSTPGDTIIRFAPMTSRMAAIRGAAR